MSVDDFIKLLQSGGGWIIYCYLFFMHVLPKIAPNYAKLINKRHTREDRLFDLIGTTNAQNEKLSSALEGLTVAFREHNHRLEKLEDCLKQK